MPVILASASPRRRELLERAGLEFEIMHSPAEEIHDASIVPERLCEMNAELKAEAIRLGMQTLRMSAINKLKEGITTVEEVTRVSAPD